MDKEAQEMFLNFILQRIQEGKEAEVKQILMDNFKKQRQGTFSKEDIETFNPKMMGLLKPEKLEEVKAVVQQFAGEFENK